MKRGLIVGVSVAVVAAAVGFWFLFIRDDSPPELSLEDAVADITGTTVGGGEPGTTVASGTTAAPSTTAPVSPDGLDGTWGIDQEFTVVGYRIGEVLSGIGTTSAVGRTSDVSGSLTLNGSVIETVAIEVNMASLTSDSSSRDEQLENRGLETNSFPTGSFELIGSVDLGSIPAADETVSIVASGNLTLHGVTQPVQIPLDGTFVDGRIVVVGSLEISLADYDIEPPTGFRVLSIEDQGVFEVQLAFTR